MRDVSDSPLDQPEFPFTEDELYRAFCLLESDQDAREEARIITECARGQREGGWSISDEAFAALALVSAELHARVDAFMRARWEAWRAGLIMTALRGEGLPPGSEPTPSALRAADEEIARYAAEWRAGCAALAEWVRRRQASEPVEDEPPSWPGNDQE